MGLLIAAIFGSITLLAAAPLFKSGASRGKSGSGGGGYTTNFWAPIVAPLALAANIPLQFVLAWIEMESSGNPCAVGNIHAHGPDGEPLEMGIVQMYNPDDFKRAGVDPAAFRRYCVPGTQRCSRKLTAQELVAQARAAMTLIIHAKQVAESVLHSIGADWIERDVLRLTKLVHALPGLAKHGPVAVTHHLGRAPESWGEFADNLSNVKLDAGTERYRWLKGSQSPFSHLLANAVRATSSVPENFNV